MTEAWDKTAARIQQMVRSGEMDDLTTYSDDSVKRAIVHIREDLVMVVSYLSSANRHLWTIKAFAFITVVLLAYIAYRLSY
jgi:hypothetical protein